MQGGGDDDGRGQRARGRGRGRGRGRRLRHGLHRDSSGERQRARRVLGARLGRRGRAQHGAERGLVAVGGGVGLGPGGGRGRGRRLHHGAQRVHGARHAARRGRGGRGRGGAAVARRPYTKPKATVIRVRRRSACRAQPYWSVTGCLWLRYRAGGGLTLRGTIRRLLRLLLRSWIFTRW